MTRIIHRVHTVDSTQDEARRLLDAGEAGPRHIIVADQQTDGRGRFGRSWLSPAGGLYATFVTPRHEQIALVAGVALLGALETFGIQAGLKWPNDVLVGDKKIAGLLIETMPDAALVGVGVNITSVPLDTATSIQAAGGAVRRGDLLLALAELLDKAATGDVASAYRQRLATIGRRVAVARSDGEVVRGTAVDVDRDGRLVVETESGLRAMSSGECHHLQDEASWRGGCDTDKLE